MARPIWKGQISFGLVNIPVTLYSAEQKLDLRFNLLDSRNSARIRYERVNEQTGEEVPWDRIVKGYEYDNGNYVLLREEEFERAAPELTKSIEIEQFVPVEQIDVRQFDKPYYVVPGKGAQKGYVLLREAMRRAERVGIARVVIRSREHLAALMTVEDALVLELLRFHQELRSLEDYDFPAGSLKEHRITTKELSLAEQLLEGMSSDWKPEDYQDSYRAQLLEYIEKRIEAGETEAVIDAASDEAEEEAATTVNFMDVLKRSVQKTTSNPKAAKTGGAASKRSKRSTRRGKKTTRKAG